MGSPLRWRDLLADAIAYAREGFSASDGQRTPPPREPDLFGPDGLARDQAGSLAPLSSRRARPRAAVQRDLARTLEAVRDGRPEAFYRGDVAGGGSWPPPAAAGSPLAIEDFAEHRSRLDGAAHDPLWRRARRRASPAHPGHVGARDAGHRRRLRRGGAAARPTTSTSSSRRPSSPSPTAIGT